MTLEELSPHISGSTKGWNDEITNIIDTNNRMINATFFELFSETSPFLEVNISEKEIRKIFRKNNNKIWLTVK